MGLGDEVVDVRLMMDDEGLEVYQVQYLGSLRLWQDEVEEEEQTKP